MLGLIVRSAPRLFMFASKRRRVLTTSLGLAAAVLQYRHFDSLCLVVPPPMSAAPVFGKKSTAKEVVDGLVPGKGLAGRVAIVTGGNSGIGAETVKALSFAGCRVVMASRSIEAGKTTVEDEIRKPGVGGYSVADADIVVKQLDLSDLESVIAFAEGVIANEERIDYLVLNAGVMALPKLERTADGFEKQIGVNHFGHALLTRLLLPKLEAQAFPSRVVTLASIAHKMASDFPVENLHYTGEKQTDYSAWGAYGRSKLANVLFAKGLAQHVAGGKITSVSVHPGVIRTPLWRSTLASGAIGGWLLNMVFCDKDIPQGASTSLCACLSWGAKASEYNGIYLADCAQGDLSALARDPELPRALWDATNIQLDAALAKRGLSPTGSKLAV